MRYFIFTMTLLACTTIVEGQSYKTRLEKMKQRYEHVDAAHIRISVQVYTSEDSKLSVFAENAEIQKKSTDYRYQFGSVDLMMNDRYIVMVDKNENAVMYATRSVESQERFK